MKDIAVFAGSRVPESHSSAEVQIIRRYAGACGLIICETDRDAGVAHCEFLKVVWQRLWTKLA